MKALIRKLKQWETALRSSFGDDISTPEMRRRARWDFMFFDHGFLRKLWTNFHEVAPGVYRSNQPDTSRYPKLAEMGIKTILNLRGISPHSHYLFAVEGTEANGMKMHSFGMQARKPVPRNELLKLIEAFRTLPKPFLMHCKSGADRAGMASALYRTVIIGDTPEQALKHLSLRYVHLKNSKTGVCDHFFEVYSARNAREAISMEDWITTEYDADALAASFARKRAKS
jgi:protein tyrosine/serine phosphatase